MAPANRAWIRSRMAGIRKASGIAFSDDIFLSILICLIAKNKHLVLNTFPEAVKELKTITEQHCSVVFGLTTATIPCHKDQTRAEVLGAITGRLTADTAAQASQASQSNTPTPSQYHSHHLHTHAHHHHHSNHRASQHSTTPSGHHYQYFNPGDEYALKGAKNRERSRRSIATNHSEISEYSQRPSEHDAAPSIASVRTTSERDHRSIDDIGSSQQRGQYSLDPSEYSRGGDDSSSLLRRKSDSRSKGAGDMMTDHFMQGRPRRSTAMSPPTDHIPMENMAGQGRRQQHSHQPSFPYMSGHHGGPSINSTQGQVTPMDFTFPKRRHESVSNQGVYGTTGETSGVTYSGRRLAQAIILDGLENASQEVYAVLLEMIINKEIYDRNRYSLPDLIIIAVFNSPQIPDNIPKQLLDYFAINCSYQHSIPQPRIPPTPRKHAHFRRTDWDELAKRAKTVTVSNDMTRYIRDVVVGIRTHEAVHGGLTSRAALDLEAIIKTLAAIFQTTFVTPDLLTIAADKVFSHRLELKSTRRKKILSAGANSDSPSTTPSPTPVHDQGHGKAPIRENTLEKHAKRDCTDSDQSSVGGASFVEISESEGSMDEPGQGSDRMSELAGEQLGGQVIMEEEKTVADVINDILKAVYPPI